MSSNARVSQQYVEILTQAPSKVRVSQQYVEILISQSASGNTYTENVTSTLNVTDTAETTRIVNISSTLNISDGVSHTTYRTIAVEDSLSITDAAVTIGQKDFSLSDSLTLSDNLSTVRERSFSLTSDLDIEDTRQLASTYIVGTDLALSSWVLAGIDIDAYPMGHVLSISDSVEFEVPGHEYVTSELEITDSYALAKPRYETAKHQIRLDSDVFVSHPIQNVSITTELGIFSRTPVTPSCFSSLNLSHEALRRLWPTHELGLIATVDVAKAKSATTVLDITSEFDCAFVFNRSFESTIETSHALTYYIPTKACAVKAYTPFQGDNTHGMDNTIRSEQRDASNNRVVLAWPNIKYPDKQVILRAPEMDDIARFTQTRAYRESRGGYLSVFSDPTWPKIHTIVATFIGLTSNEANDFQDFVYETIGQEIYLGDWNGYLWVGIIKNPDEPIVWDGKRGYTISFEFEGREVPRDYSIQSLDLEETTDYEVGKWFIDSVDLTSEVSYTINRVINLENDLSLGSFLIPGTEFAREVEDTLAVTDTSNGSK